MPFDPEKRRARKRRYYKKNREKVLTTNKKWAQNHPETFKKSAEKYYSNPENRKKQQTRARRAHYFSSYLSATEADYQHYLESTHCECCGSEFKNSRDRHQHHDHNTQQLVGVWCSACNKGEGLIKTHDRAYQIACKMAEQIPLAQLIDQATKGIK